MSEIKFVVKAIKYRDKVNGNTYHSSTIFRTRDGSKCAAEFQYGYGEQFKHTAIQAMIKAEFIPSIYDGNEWNYERESNYPILWIVNYGTKKECKANGIN